jgi:predicted ArsR family transcriptional regulator
MVGPDDFDAQVARISALGEPIRRALYRFVVAQPEPVSREGAAAGVGVAHHAAKFHLDKLEADGLLEVEYRRPAGRAGPGAGRPTKLYRRSSREVAVSLPERRYDLAGRIMASAITAAQRTATPVADALSTAAGAAGRALGERAQHMIGRRPAVEIVHDVLADTGYQPVTGTDGIALANCPFGSLAASYTDVVCGINLELVEGLLTALHAGDELHARLAPAPGRCCVIVDTAPARSS